MGQKKCGSGNRSWPYVTGSIRDIVRCYGNPWNLDVSFRFILKRLKHKFSQLNASRFTGHNHAICCVASNSFISYVLFTLTKNNKPMTLLQCEKQRCSIQFFSTSVMRWPWQPQLQRRSNLREGRGGSNRVLNWKTERKRHRKKV